MILLSPGRYCATFANPRYMKAYLRFKNMKKTYSVYLIFLLGLIGLGLTACSQDNRPAMISSANPHASRAGAQMLEKGGSAIDAAIAAQLVLGLVEPQSSGIGGGAFALYWDAKNGKITSFDGREKAPEKANGRLFIDAGGQPLAWPFASIGGRPVGVPGVVAMAWKAHKKYGRLEWAQLFEPAIALAENGFIVSPRLHETIVKEQDILIRDAGARSIYFSPESTEPLAIGSTLKNPAYAKTLKMIAEKGPDGFYRGPVAEAIVAAVKSHGENPGLLSLDDLKNYAAVEREAVCAPYRAYKVCGMAPPTSGGLTSLMILGMLEHFDLGALEPGSAVAMHLFTQASRLAYADRNIYMADTDFVSVPVSGLLDKNYLKSRARLINPLNDMGKTKAGAPPTTDPALKKAAGLAGPEYGTSHLSVVDKFGNAVSMTTSVERRFGSHIMAGGFILNSQLTDFSFVPVRDGVDVANAVQANKRPRSSMSPTLVFGPDGQLFAAIGSPGGSRIIEFVSRTLVGLIDWKLSVKDAISLGNVNNRNGGITELEEGTAIAGFADQFTAMGHKVKVKKLNSGLHGIRIKRTDETVHMDGGADPRREGLVIELR